MRNTLYQSKMHSPLSPRHYPSKRDEAIHLTCLKLIILPKPILGRQTFILGRYVVSIHSLAVWGPLIVRFAVQLNALLEDDLIFQLPLVRVFFWPCRLLWRACISSVTSILPWLAIWPRVLLTAVAYRNKGWSCNWSRVRMAMLQRLPSTLDIGCYDASLYCLYYLDLILVSDLSEYLVRCASL